MTKNLANKKRPQHKADIIITAEEVPNNANSEIFIFEANCKLPESSGLYFYVVLKYKGSNSWTPVYKSEVRRAESNSHVVWNACSLGCTDLCNDNME